MGLTRAQIAERLDITVRTIYRWENDHEEFCHAVKQGMDMKDELIEGSLFQRAMGYSHKAVKIFMPAGAKEPIYAEYMEHFPPDTGAAIFLLKNKKPDTWRDRREYTFEGDKPPVVINSNTATELLDPSQQDNLELGEKS